MKAKNQWEANAIIIETEYDGFVNWKERYYECPICGEIIEENEWGKSLEVFLCPICKDTPIFWDDEKEDY